MDRTDNTPDHGSIIGQRHQDVHGAAVVSMREQVNESIKLPKACYRGAPSYSHRRHQRSQLCSCPEDSAVLLPVCMMPSPLSNGQLTQRPIAEVQQNKHQARQPAHSVCVSPQLPKCLQTNRPATRTSATAAAAKPANTHAPHRTACRGEVPLHAFLLQCCCTLTHHTKLRCPSSSSLPWVLPTPRAGSGCRNRSH
jgi:hypothetical protein